MVNAPQDKNWPPELGSGAVVRSRPLGIEIERERPDRRHRAASRSNLPAALIVLGLIVGALLLGLSAGLQPLPTLAVVVGGIVGLTLLLRLRWAALLLVGTAVFEDYLVVVDPRVVKLTAVVLIGAWLIERSAGPLRDRSHSATVIAALGLVIVLLLATVVHNNGAVGFAVLLRYAGFLAVLVVLIDTMRRGLSPGRVARVYVASCAIAAVLGIVGYFLGQDRRVGGPIADPNDFAFFLLAAVPLAVGLRRLGRRSWPWDLALLLLVLGVAGTLSRGAILGLLVMTVVALISGMIRLRVVLALGVLIGTALSLTAALFPHLVEVSLQQKEYIADQNVSQRFQLWEAASRMTLESPVLGLGPGSFSLYSRDYMRTVPIDPLHDLDVAHNTYLELSSELGVLGLAVFLTILGSAFLGGWSRWRRDGDELAGAVCVALAGSAAASAFLTEQYFLPLWLLCALGAALAVRSGSEESEPTVPPRTLALPAE